MAVTLVGCNATKTESKTETNFKTHMLTESEAAFCWALLEQSIQEGENAFLSPASAAMALNILKPGAAGATLDELQAVVPDMLFNTTEQLKVASAIWINEDLKVLPSFLEANASAEVYNEPIKANKVNKWASKKTNGKVKEVLSDPLPPDLKMCITNALYFKDEWSNPFEKEDTRQEPFYGKKGEQQVSMMHQTNDFSYMETEKLQAISLRYKGPYYMEIYLPKKGAQLEDVIKLLQDTSETLEAKGEQRNVRLALPKVKLEYEKKLNDYFKQLGLRTCFTTSADFSGISPTPLCVDFIKQNTFLAIDEKSTEAAAVTTIAMADCAYVTPVEPISMTVDHPFVLLIREKDTKQVLFYGVIQDIQE